MATVEFRDLHKTYAHRPALSGLSFSVDDGEFFCLLGPPGAGKTTTFRVIAGLDQPDQGEVRIGGANVLDVPPQQRDVAMVFEDTALYPHMSGFGNIGHPLFLRRIPETEIRDRVGAISEMLQISHLLDRHPDTYSGGERRRVAVARAMVRSPRVMLLDQALTDLDAKIRQEMAGELKRIQRETHQTMIYASHDFEEAIAMGERILVIQRGAEVQTGGPEEIYFHPRTSFVAGFVGSPPMNLLRCQVRRENGMLYADHAAFSLPLASTGVDLPAAIMLGIRPEHIQLTSGEREGDILARVEVVQISGAEQIVDLSLRDGSVLKLVASADLSWKTGEQARLRFPHEWIYFFDGATEELLTAPTAV